MADAGYVWDEDKYDLARREHDVGFSEVVSALEDPLALEELDPQGHWERHLLVGRAWSGRVLQVIYSDEDLPLVRIVTAFDANEHWRRSYERSS